MSSIRMKTVRRLLGDLILEGFKGMTIMLPVDVQSGEAIFAGSAVLEGSATILAGGSGNVDIGPPAGFHAVIFLTNHLDSGANISLNYLAYFDGTTETKMKTSHIGSGAVIFIEDGHKLRGNFSNAGAADETAYLRAFGKLIKT